MTGPRESESGHATGPQPEGVLAGDHVDPWAQLRQRLRRQIATGARYRDALMAEPGLTVAALARREGTTATKVSMATGLLRLHDSILVDLADGSRTGPVPTLLDVERIARIRNVQKQVSEYQRLCRQVGSGAHGNGEHMPRQRGFQHLLIRARRYQAWLDEGAHRSLASIARAEGITPGRVGVVLDLLSLPAAILAVVDVPPDRVPPGLRHEELRRICRLDGHERQMAAFARFLPASGG